MAATKVVTALFQVQTLTAAAGDRTSTAVALTDSYGATVNIKITNEASGPTTPAECQIEVSEDNSEFYAFGGPLVSKTGNSSAIAFGGIQIPIGTQHLRLVVGSQSKDQSIDADLSEVTAI